MLRHVVMLKFLEEAEGCTKEENLLKVKNDLYDLQDKIEVMKYIEVGINAEEATDSNYDLVLINDFESIEDLDSYQIHDAHQEVLQYIKKVITSRTCVDFNY